MEELLTQLNINGFSIVFSLVLGFIMLSTYNFVNYNKLLDNGVTTIFSSFIVGYMYYYIVTFIPFSLGLFVDCIGIILIGIILAYIVARIISNKHIATILAKLKIRRTVNHIIWTDLIDMDYTMKVQVNMADGYSYVGFLGITESYSQTPVVSLYGYKIINTKTNIALADYSRVSNRTIVLDTRKANSVELIYGTDTPKGNVHKDFINGVTDEMYRDSIVENNTD
jgi:hypothetical protein